MRSHIASSAHRESGSITPLAIGFCVIVLALVTVITIITDYYMAHRKLYAIADSAALAAVESYQPVPGGKPTFVFDAHGIEKKANQHVARISPPSNLSHIRVSAHIADSRNVHVTAHARYKPILTSPFVPKGIELTSTTKARGALR